MPTLPSASSVTDPPVGAKPAPMAKQEQGAQSPARKKKTSLSYRKRVFRLIVVSAVLGGLIFLGIIIISSGLRRQIIELTQKRSALEALSRREENYHHLKQSLEVAGEDSRLLKQALLTEPDVNLLLEQISELKNKHGLTIENLAFSTDQPSSDRQGNFYIELIFEAVGETSQIQPFLNEFVSQPRVIKIKLIDIDRLDEKDQRLMFKAWFYTDSNFTGHTVS